MSIEAKKTVDLEKIRDDYKAAASKIQRRIIICAGTGCVANGSLEVRDALAEALKKAGVDVTLELRKEEEHTGTYISKSGCQGFCQMGPLLHIEPGDILYTKVKVADVPEIVERTLQRGEVIDRLLFVHPKTGAHCKGDADIPFYNRQKRVVLANCRIEPGCVREYIARGGYFGARKAILEMTPEEVCQTAIDSGLRGRGGGGFPTGLKWKFTLASKNDKKYVICNGDEGDPGAFMDRSVMEGNPHAVIEGMMIAARAIGADEGYVYVRAEYPLAVTRMRAAVKDAEEAGLLGDHLFGSDFSFRVNVMEGAGAFVCGEETALIASIEGKRGMPRHGRAGHRRRRSRRSRLRADCGASRRSSTTSKRSRRFPASSSRGRSSTRRSVRRSPPAPRPSLSPVTWPTPDSLRFPSAPRCAKSSTTSAAASPTTRAK